MKQIFGKGKDDKEYHFQFKFLTLSNLTKGAGIEKFSISWERNDKKKNGNTPAYTIGAKAEEFTIDYSAETTSTFDSKQTKHKPVHFYVRDENEGQKKKYEKIIHLSEFIDEKWMEHRDEWELIGWSNKHPNAKIKLLIRSWPEGDVNLGIQRDIDEREKKMNDLKESMRLAKEKKELQKAWAALSPEEKEEAIKKQKEQEEEEALQREELEKIKKEKVEYYERKELERKEKLHGDKDRLEREKQEKKERLAREEAELLAELDKEDEEKEKTPEKKAVFNEDDYGDDDSVMAELLKKEEAKEDMKPVVEEKPKRITMKKPSIMGVKSRIDAIRERSGSQGSGTSEHSDYEYKVEQSPSSGEDQSPKREPDEKKELDKPKRINVRSKISTPTPIPDRKMPTSSQDGSGDEVDLLSFYEWDEIIISKLYSIELNFAIEKDYDEDEEISKIEIIEQPATFYFPLDEFSEVFTNKLYRMKDSFEYDVNYEEAERLAKAGVAAYMDQSAPVESKKLTTSSVVSSGSDPELFEKYKEKETRVIELELEMSVLQKTLDRYKKLAERGGVSGSSEDVEQLKVILENTKNKVKEVTNKKDNELQNFRLDIRKREGDLEILNKKFKIAQHDISSAKQDISGLKSEIETLITQSREKDEIIIAQLNKDSEEGSSIPIKLQKLVTLEIEVEELKLELNRSKKEKEGLIMIKQMVETSDTKYREELRIAIEKLDELELFNKSLKDEVETYKDEIKESNQAIDQMKANRRRDEQALERNEDQIKKSKQTIIGLKTEVKELNDKIDVLEKTIKDLNNGKDVDSTGQLKLFKEKVQNLEADKKRMDVDSVEASTKSREAVRRLQNLNDKLNQDLVAAENKIKEEQEKQIKNQRDQQTQAVLIAQKSQKSSAKQYQDLKDKLDQTTLLYGRLQEDIEENKEMVRKKVRAEINLNNELNNVRDSLRRTTHEKVDLEFRITDLEEKLTKISQGQRVVATEKSDKKQEIKRVTVNHTEHNAKDTVLVNPGKKINTEDLECFPVVALKKGILTVVAYFEENVENRKIDLKDLGNSTKYPEVIAIVKTNLIQTLNAVFKHAYVGTAWFGGGHHWDLFEEVSTLYDDGGQENLKLQMAVETTKSFVSDWMRRVGLPHGMSYSQALFDSFLFYSLNQGVLHTVIKFVILHPDQLNKHFRQEATLRNQDQQKKLFKFLGLIALLPFQIEMNQILKP